MAADKLYLENPIRIGYLMNISTKWEIFYSYFDKDIITLFSHRTVVQFVENPHCSRIYICC